MSLDDILLWPTYLLHLQSVDVVDPVSTIVFAELRQQVYHFRVPVLTGKAQRIQIFLMCSKHIQLILRVSTFTVHVSDSELGK